MAKLKKILSRIFKDKKIVTFFVLSLVIGIFGVAGQTHADTISVLMTPISLLLGSIVYLIVQFVGLLLALILWVFGGLINYNDFINATPVTVGWAIVRDICNMFFILILLFNYFKNVKQFNS